MTNLALLPLLFAAAAPETWHIKADYIEACSCSLFCPCYFNTKPEGGMHCEFNNAVFIREGHVGDVKVDNTKVWLSGDLGGDFTKGMKGVVVTFDAATTEAQRGAIGFLMNQVYPVKWESVKTDVQPIVWERTGGNGYAKLGDGMAEVKLTAAMDGDKPTVIHNLKYWGAQKNSGFELAYGTHHYRGFGYDYDYENRNGFFITIESSGDSSTSR